MTSPHPLAEQAESMAGWLARRNRDRAGRECEGPAGRVAGQAMRCTHSQAAPRSRSVRSMVGLGKVGCSL